MIQSNTPRIIIAGTSSGCGKTTITCAILKLLTLEKKKVASFKCGPDYIDPMFYKEILGTKSCNLDAYFCDNATIQYLLKKNTNDQDIAIIEGVMGFYDGKSLTSSKASTYEISQITDSPVILTVNCSGLSTSAVAIIKGFKEYKSNNIVGVILNNITEKTYFALKNAIKDYFHNKIAVLGYLPKLPQDIILKSRHLGLVTAGEIDDIQDKIEKLADIAKKTIDLKKIISIAQEAIPISHQPIALPHSILPYNKRPRIALANDSAFCFYYRDNLELLETLGAELVYFSPLEDKTLPDTISGLYFGGGYPELYAKKLSENTTLLCAIKKSLQNKIPCIAECGGFMYLSKSIDSNKMVDFFSGESTNNKKLTRFGYTLLTAKSDCMILKKGQSIKGHEFHYYDCTKNGEDLTATGRNNTTWNCCIANNHMYAGYPHLHFYSNIDVAKNFVTSCAKYTPQ